MKKILLIIVSLLAMCILSPLMAAGDGSARGDLEMFNSLPDDWPDDTVPKREYISYTYGHHGYAWALAVREAGEIRFYSGRVGPDGRKHAADGGNDAGFDTLRFIAANRAIFEWGFDSLAQEASRMTPVKWANFILGAYTSLATFDSTRALTFDSKNASGFAGPDSVGFNARFKRLSKLMFWVSSSLLREQLPLDVVMENH